MTKSAWIPFRPEALPSPLREVSSFLGGIFPSPKPGFPLFGEVGKVIAPTQTPLPEKQIAEARGEFQYSPYTPALSGVATWEEEEKSRQLFRAAISPPKETAPPGEVPVEVPVKVVPIPYYMTEYVPTAGFTGYTGLPSWVKIASMMGAVGLGAAAARRYRKRKLSKKARRRYRKAKLRIKKRRR